MCGVKKLLQRIAITAIALTGNAKLALAEPQELLVVTEFSPPYQTLNDNQISGFATDVVQDILEKSGLKYQIELYPWARAYNFASTRSDVLIYAIAKTPERLAHFHWVAPIYEFKPHLVGLKGSDNINITSLEDAKNYSIAVQRLDFAHKYLESQGFKEGVNLILTNSIVDSWHLLKNGKVDLIVDDLVYEIQPDGKLLRNNEYKRFFPLKDLHQTTFLAANINMPAEIIERLRNAAFNIYGAKTPISLN